MNVTVEQANKNEVKLTVRVSPERFEQAMQEAYMKVRNQINVPGFRRGKAPRKVIENTYTESVFYEDAMDIVLPEAYDTAIKENDIFAVDRPQVEILEVGSGKDFVFTAQVTVKPEVELGEYKGLKVDKVSYPVTDEDVQKEIDAVRERIARWVDVDRTVENGDRVMIDYKGSVDGVLFEGGSADNQSLEIGSGRFIPGFEEQLIGMAKEEERSINVTFPEEYHSADLAGKAATFEVKLHDIKAKELPEVDDDFVKDVSEFETLDEYTADIRKNLEHAAEHREEDEMNDALLKQAVENATMDIPQCMVDRQVDRMLSEFEYSMAYQGIKMEDYLKMTGMDIQTMRDQSAEEALRRVKASLVLEKIQKTENIACEDADMEEEIEHSAMHSGKSVEEFSASLTDEDREYMKDSVIMQKTLAFLRDNAKVKAPKKKSAKKEVADEE